jgi:cytochrome c-type biogenesis protein CcmH/NrfG
MVVRRQGHTEQAVAYLRQALRLKPEFAEANCSLGDALFQQGKLAEAAIFYREALRLRPNYPDACNNLGNTLMGLGQAAEALASYRQAIHWRPNFAEAHCNLGDALAKARKTEEALACFREAVRLRPNYSEAYNSLGNVLIEAGHWEEAAICHREALRLRPDCAEAEFNLCYGLKAQGKAAEAAVRYQDALRLYPDHADGHFNLAHALLLLGNFTDGWAEYEWRWKTKGWSAPVAVPPRWDGSPLNGRTLILHAEQGFGDTIQFVRYASLLKRRNAVVLFVCQKRLARLLERTPGVDRLIPSDVPAPPADVYAPLLSLPHLLGTTLNTVPAEIPYLTPEAELVERWKHKLGASSNFRVGIAWQGQPEHAKDRERSVPLRQFAPLACIEGVQLISLQKGFGAEQLAEVGDLLPVVELGLELDQEAAFVDTAAIMTNLDLVVAVDSAVAHLAGALGVPVWVVLPIEPDWRWLLDRDDNPWYPTMRLFRQTARGDWPGVFARVAAALREKPERHLV